MKLRCVCFLAGIVLSGDAAAAQDRQTDSLYISGELDSGAITGGGGQAELVRAMSSRTHMILGAGSMFVADEWWTFGRIGGFTRRRDFTFLAASDLGWGRRNDGGFPYLRSRGGATIPVGHRFYALTEAQYIRSAGIGTRVLSAGAMYAGVRRTLLQATFHASATSTARWQYTSVRADVMPERIRAFGGVTIGHAPAQLSEAGAIQLLALTSQNFFAGVSIPSHRADTILAFEVARQPGGGRTGRLSVALRLPLAAPSASPVEPSR
jgi:hypothetical protein